MNRLSKILLVLLLVGGGVWTAVYLLSDPDAAEPELTAAKPEKARSAVKVTPMTQTEISVAEAITLPDETTENDVIVAVEEPPVIDLAYLRAQLEGGEDLKNILDAAWTLMQDKKISQAEYDALLLDLEEWIHTSGSDKVATWNYLRAHLNELPEIEGQPNRRGQFMEDVASRFAFVWGTEDPRQSLEFLAMQPDTDGFMEGWLTSQIYNDTDFEPLLEEMRITPPPDTVWRSLQRVAQLDAFAALDYARDHFSGEMTPKKWKELFDTQGGANDELSIAWIEANQDFLMAQDDFNAVEVARLLRRYHFGGEIFYDSAHVELINDARAKKQFTQGAAILEDLKNEYGEIDSAAIGRFALEWSYNDFSAAEAWLLANESYYSDVDAFDSALGTMYRHRAQRDPEFAREQALALTDEWQRALATSNTIIPETEKGGLNVTTTWVAEMPQGFAKQRTIAGYVLGLSRNASEAVLEGQVKAQFLRDEFDLNQIGQLVHQSDLSQSEKIAALELIQSY